jgi:hypothetical protein
MSVYRCNKCGFVAEETLHVPGGKIPCAKCANPVTLFATVFYVEKLIERYTVMRRELEALKQPEDADAQATVVATAGALQLPKDEIHNTPVLATEAQHQPLHDWFAARQITPVFDYARIDTTGFFDEAALILGSRYELLRSAIEQVRFAYRQDWSWINVDLGKKSPPEAQAIIDAFRQLYSYTFFSRYSYQRQKNLLGMSLQPALAIRQFFEGGWLEWWAFMQLLQRGLECGANFSCTRGVHIEFQNEGLRELDVMFLLKKRFPIVVECKTGEFRGEIDKYVRLRRRLSLDRSQFVVCNPDLTDEQTVGMSAMYDLTFVNLQSFVTHTNVLFA